MHFENYMCMYVCTMYTSCTIHLKSFLTLCYAHVFTLLNHTENYSHTNSARTALHTH